MSSSPVILASELAFPEGPAFDSQGALWCVELTGGTLWRRTRTGEVSRRRVGGRPNGIAIDGRDRVWFCDSGLDAVRVYDPATNSVETVIDRIDGTPLAKPNDLVFDRLGNLIFTCPGDSRTEPTGYVCVLTPDGDCAQIASGLYFPNGVGLDRDGALLIAETRRQRLWRGAWNADARVLGPLVELCPTQGPIGPDGLAVAADGDIFVAVYGTGAVEVNDPDGRRMRTLSIPGQNPTNCAFDPSGELGLVVTDGDRGEVLSFPGEGPGLQLFRPLFD